MNNNVYVDISDNFIEIMKSLQTKLNNIDNLSSFILDEWISNSSDYYECVYMDEWVIIFTSYRCYRVKRDRLSSYLNGKVDCIRIEINKHVEEILPLADIQFIGLEDNISDKGYRPHCNHQEQLNQILKNFEGDVNF